EINAQELPVRGIHRRVKKLLGIHFAKTLEPLDGQPTPTGFLDRSENLRNGEQRLDDRPFAFTFMNFKKRLVLAGVVLDAKNLLSQLAQQGGGGFAFEVQVGNFRAPRRAVLLALDFRVAAKK